MATPIELERSAIAWYESKQREEWGHVGEYAVIKESAPIASVRGEAKSFMGEDFPVNNEACKAVTADVVKFGESYNGYSFIGAGDFISLLMVHVVWPDE